MASIGALIALFGVLGGATATAVTNPVTYQNANVTTCAQIGFAGSTQYNGSVVTSVSVTALFTATVTSDRYVTISAIAPGVVFQAAAIKGGDGYNVYNPLLTDMRSPLNGGGNVPALSHWFACYTYTPIVTTTTAP
ncbi:MAG: hypothetical protein Q8M22_02820, partial [Actinomycetota bacterium]|nr:hypothetical protein [Actinomycetota bacterium]